MPEIWHILQLSIGCTVILLGEKAAPRLSDRGCSCPYRRAPQLQPFISGWISSDPTGNKRLYGHIKDGVGEELAA